MAYHLIILFNIIVMNKVDCENSVCGRVSTKQVFFFCLMGLEDAVIIIKKSHYQV